MLYYQRLINSSLPALSLVKSTLTTVKIHTLWLDVQNKKKISKNYGVQTTECRTVFISLLAGIQFRIAYTIQVFSDIGVGLITLYTAGMTAGLFQSILQHWGITLDYILGYSRIISENKWWYNPGGFTGAVKCSKTAYSE